MKNDKWLRQFAKTAAILVAVAICTSYATPTSAGGMHYTPDDKALSKDSDKAKDSGRPELDRALRQNEDWSSFNPVAANSKGVYNYTDPLKHINLTDHGSIWLSIGGSARARYEHYDNYKFTPKYDDGFLLTRARLHGDLHVGENLRVFTEVKSAFSTERDLSGGQRTMDTDELSLQQAFGDLRLDVGEESVLTLRGGRQMLSFGNQRLISPDEYSNSMRTWDGVSAVLDHGGWNAQAFWTQYVPVKKYDFNTSDRQTQLFGVYATGPACDEYGIHTDAYFLGLDQSDTTNTFNGTNGAERRYTVGGRLFGQVPNSGLDYDAEATYQFGDVGASAINAWSFATEIGYTFKSKTKVRPFIGLDYASGDDSSGGDVQTFNPLFPNSHEFLGYADHVGRQNILALNTGVAFKPTKKLKVYVAGHAFWRANTNDALYNASGSVLVAGGAAENRFVGGEIDTKLKYKLDRNTNVILSYSHFFTGSFIDNGAPTKNDDIDAVKLQIEWTF